MPRGGLPKRLQDQLVKPEVRESSPHWSRKRFCMSIPHPAMHRAAIAASPADPCQYDVARTNGEVEAVAERLANMRSGERTDLKTMDSRSQADAAGQTFNPKRAAYEAINSIRRNFLHLTQGTDIAEKKPCTRRPKLIWAISTGETGKRRRSR